MEIQPFSQEHEPTCEAIISRYIVALKAMTPAWLQVCESLAITPYPEVAIITSSNDEELRLGLLERIHWQTDKITNTWIDALLQNHEETFANYALAQWLEKS